MTPAVSQKLESATAMDNKIIGFIIAGLGMLVGFAIGKATSDEYPKYEVCAYSCEKANLICRQERLSPMKKDTPVSTEICDVKERLCVLECAEKVNK